jgi:hypothetical protein
MCAITLRKVLLFNPACVQALKFKESRMGITLLSLESLLAPWQRLLAWVAQVPRSLPAPPRARAGAAHAAGRSCSSWIAPPGSCRDRPRRPLRVVRAVEPCRAPAGAGRMVISGRMADVCAELDRLAALEAAAG